MKPLMKQILVVIALTISLFEVGAPLKGMPMGLPVAAARASAPAAAETIVAGGLQTCPNPRVDPVYGDIWWFVDPCPPDAEASVS
jgi:hypothetical protein